MIFLIFQYNTGYPHPHRDAAIRNYEALLSAMGRGRGSIRLALCDAYREADTARPASNNSTRQIACLWRRCCGVPHRATPRMHRAQLSRT